MCRFFDTPFSLGSYEMITFNDYWFQKKEYTFNTSSNKNFKLYHSYNLVDNDREYLSMEKMPGFRISWKYSNTIIPDRKFFALGEKEKSTSNLNNNVFNRFVSQCQK